MESSSNGSRFSDLSRGQSTTSFTDVSSSMTGVPSIDNMGSTQPTQALHGHEEGEVIPQSGFRLLTTTMARFRQPGSRITSFDMEYTRLGLIEIGRTLGEREQLNDAMRAASNIFADFVGKTCTHLKAYVDDHSPRAPTGTQSWRYVPSSTEYTDAFMSRDTFVRRLSWAVPSLEALEMIKEYAGDSKVLEIFAGRGLWSLLLRLLDVHVVATDREPKTDGFCHVRAQSATEAVRAERDANLLLMCWAPYDDPADYDALIEYEGEYVVTVAEGHGGCVGSDQFWNYIHEHFVGIDYVDIPQWYGIHDHLEVWKRSTEVAEDADDDFGSVPAEDGLASQPSDSADDAHDHPPDGGSRESSDDADDDILLQPLVQGLGGVNLLAQENADGGNEVQPPPPMTTWHRLIGSQPSEGDGYDSYADYGCGDPWCSYCGQWRDDDDGLDAADESENEAELKIPPAT